MNTYFITAPNTCCLVHDSASVIYTQNYTGPIEVPGTSTFEEFLTPDDALVRAKELDPNYDSNNILGPLDAQVISSSDLEPVVSKNDDIAFICEVECDGLPITYTWTGPNGAVIPGATSDTYTILEATETDAGQYSCIGTAENAKGQTGVNGALFTLTVLNNQGNGLG
jgi:hypothetical protein